MQIFIFETKIKKFYIKFKNHLRRECWDGLGAGSIGLCDCCLVYFAYRRSFVILVFDIYKFIMHEYNQNNDMKL